MRAGVVGGRWRPMVGVLVVGVFTFGLTLQGATTPEQKKAYSDRAGGQAAVSTQGLPAKSIDSTVDYRADDALRAGGLGGVAFPACALDEECNDCDPCTEDTCVDTVCVNRPYGPAEAAPDCDDGIYCNGYEICVAGECAPSPYPPCLVSAPLVCDEATQNCVDACTSDADCDDDRYCTTVDDCVRQCEGGSLHGMPCADDTYCQSLGDTYSRCVDTCVYTDADCGLLGTCTEGATTYGCSVGRCCDYTVTPPTCTPTTRDNCTQQWLGVADCTQTEPPLNCPAYGSGVIDGSVVNWDYPDPTPGVVTFGPVSGLDCDFLRSIGDDYTLDIPQDYFLLDVIRFVGGVMPGWSARFSMELRDSDGFLIENWFWPNGVNAAADQSFVGTVRIDPPLVIPKSGILSMSVMENFGPGGRIYWMSTDNPTRAVDVGSNSPTTMYINGAKTTVDVLGQCDGGDRHGLWCDRRNGDADCPDGTCEDVPDILAFELIGNGTTEPWGACCGVGGSCFHVLPWECDAIGGKFKGQGTYCGLCTNPANLYDPCDGDEDCSGVEGACQDRVCNQALTECDTDEDCPELETCINLATVCGTQACCNDSLGTCREALPGDACVTGETSLGFATDCNPNCCDQPITSGYNNCNLAGLSARIIEVPPVGAVEPVTVETWTGSNVGATYDDHEQGWCDRDIFDPDGDTKDPGWWEAFSLTACANIRIELCCTDIDGEPLRPAWANLYTGCPCDQILQRVGVDPPIGIGIGTDGGARGGPFCTDDDNFWQTYGPLPAGTYYYPIYSAPDGTGASPPGQTYQLNVYAAACPESQCCYLECSATATNPGELCENHEDCPAGTCDPVCAVLNVLDCNDRNGWWVPDTPDCTEGVCDTGACCTGPGTCEDEVTGQPMDQSACYLEGGTYWGGAECPATVDDPDPCPICEIEDPLVCSMYSGWPDVDGWVVFMDDTSVYPEMGRADDFVATAGKANEVCLWGSWIDTSLAGGRRDCACVDDSGDPECPSVVDDQFTVKIWTNSAPPLRKPDVLVGTTTATMVGRRRELQGTGFDIWGIALQLDTPIPALPEDELALDATYWLDITNNTVGDPNCTFYWMGDGSRIYGPEYGAVENANQWHYRTYNDPVYDPGDYEGLDMTWCIDAGTVPPGDSAPDGRCCLCDPLGDCLYDKLGVCDEAEGAWDPNETCDPNTCPSVRPANDDCADGPTTVPQTGPVDFQAAFNNVCATTDGPNPVTSEGGPGQYMLKDVWFQHVAIDSDFVTVDVCDAPYDGIIAIYTDGSGTCTCPTTAATQYGPADDEGCGPGGGQPGRIVTQFTVGVCYLIRVAGWAAEAGDNAEMGSGTLKIHYGATCPHPFPPAPAEPDPVIPRRVKHVSFSAPGGEVQANAVRVTLTDSFGNCSGGATPGLVCHDNAECAPGTCKGTQFPGSIGQSWYVGAPRAVSEVAGKQDATPPVYQYATLEEASFCDDWSQYGIVHVGGPHIAPNCEYTIELVPCGCEPFEDAYSDPVVVVTSRWGDTVGASCGDPPIISNVVDFNDIGCEVDKFKNLVGAIQKSRADIWGGTCSGDLIVDFTDIPEIVDAFTGAVYSPACAP